MKKTRLVGHMAHRPFDVGCGLCRPGHLEFLRHLLRDRLRGRVRCGAALPDPARDAGPVGARQLRTGDARCRPQFDAGMAGRPVLVYPNRGSGRGKLLGSRRVARPRSGTHRRARHITGGVAPKST